MSLEETAGGSDLGRSVDTAELLERIDLDDDEIAWRKEFVDFDETDAERLTELEGLFREHTGTVAEEFYANLTAYDETADVIDRSTRSVESLKQTQSAYLVTLATGEYDSAYFENRAKIGKIHDLLDMPAKHYIGQYGIYYNLIVPLLIDQVRDRLAGELAADGASVAGESDEDERNGDDPGESGDDGDDSDVVIGSETPDTTFDTVDDQLDWLEGTLLSVLRIVNLDMQVAMDTYIDSYANQLREEIEQSQHLQDTTEETVDELQATSSDVAGNAERINELASGLSGDMGEVSGEVADLSAAIEEVASVAHEVRETSATAERRATESGEAADDAIEAMQRADDASTEITADIEALGQRIDEIDEIVEVIDEVASRTNLLALNAAIEAARAGEAGEGFAVVADEVKSLAEQSREHAAEIERTIDEIQADTEATIESVAAANEQVIEGIDRTEDAVQGLSEIVDAVRDTATGVEGVAAAADDQAEAVEGVANMIDRAANRTDELARAIEEIAAANEEQTAMVTDLSQRVDELQTAASVDVSRF